jgi:hypothetical protein
LPQRGHDRGDPRGDILGRVDAEIVRAQLDDRQLGMDGVAQEQEVGGALLHASVDLRVECLIGQRGNRNYGEGSSPMPSEHTRGSRRFRVWESCRKLKARVARDDTRERQGALVIARRKHAK